MQGTYYYFRDDLMLEFDGENLLAVSSTKLKRELSATEKKELKPTWSKHLTRLKAIIQRYNRDLIMNETKVK